MDGQCVAGSFLDTLNEDQLCPCGFRDDGETTLATCKAEFVNAMEIAYAEGHGRAFGLLQEGAIASNEYGRARMALRSSGVRRALADLNQRLSAACPSGEACRFASP